MQAKTIKHSDLQLCLINNINERIHRGDIEKGIIYSKH